MNATASLSAGHRDAAVLAQNPLAKNIDVPSASAPSAAPLPVAFRNLIHFLLQPDPPVQTPVQAPIEIHDAAPGAQPESNGTSSPPAAGSTPSGLALTASPAQIADALVRSMLGTRPTMEARSIPGTSSAGAHAGPGAATGGEAGGGAGVGAGAGTGKKITDSMARKRPGRDSTDQVGRAMQPLPPNPVANLGALSTGDAVNESNPGPANPGAAAGPLSPSLVTGAAADFSGAAPSTGHSTLHAGTAFEARLTPKTATPDAAPAPAGSMSPVPEGPPGSAAGRDFNQRSGPKSGDGDAPASAPPGNSDSGNSFMSHAVAIMPVAAAPAASASGGATAGGAAADAQPPVQPALSEPSVSPAPAHVREMTVRIAAPDAAPVDVQVNQRQGQVFVAVRTADPSLQTSLRQDLSQLVTSLDRAGFRTETFVPHVSSQPTVVSAAETSLGNATPDSSHDSGRDSRQDSSRQPPNQQQHQQRQREQMHHRWLDQMED